MKWPIAVLGFLLGSMPKTASALRFRQQLGDALDSSLSGVPLSHEDYDEACGGKPPAQGGLHVCPRCDSKLVQPVEWTSTSRRDQWRLLRRCPNCGWQSEGIHDLDEIDAFDDVLEIGSEALGEELKQLEREGVREIADVFSAALEADLITADDFRL